MAAIIKMGLYGLCAIGLLTGAYILYLAYYRPAASFRKPELAKRQGLIALAIGAAALAAILIFKI
jgi:hypothetical protein